jgi:thiamine-phosphate pyrophosphorylase
MDGLHSVCARVSLPVVAIGGITVARAGAVRAAGASGVAAISLFSDSVDIREAVVSVRNALTPQLGSV